MYINMKVAKKLILSFILVATIANIAGFVGLILLKTQDTKYSNALIANTFVLGAVGDYNTYLNKGGALVRDAIMFTDADDIKEVQIELAEVDKLTAQSLEDIRISCRSSEEVAFFKKFDEATSRYMEARNRAVELGLQNRDDEALSIFRNEASPYLNECMTSGQDLMKLYVTAGNTISSHLTTSSNIAMITMILVMIGTGIAAIILACIVSRSIS